MNKAFLTFGVLFFLVFSLQAQKNKPQQDAGPFDVKKFNELLLHELNGLRSKNGVDSFDVMDPLRNAASFSAVDMSKANRADAVNAGKMAPKYLKKAGCTNKGTQLVVGVPMGKGKNTLKPADVVKEVMKKWANGKKEKAIYLNPANVYIGIAAEPDKSDKKLFVSVMFGNFQSFNAGAKKKGELKVPFNTKSKKLKEPDVRKCKNCDKFKDAEALQKGLYVENGKIFLKYDNIKNLKRLLKKSTDGLAVDIVQKDQYSKADYNIMDNSLRNKGVMQKVVYKDKLLSKNLIKPDKKSKKPQKINKLLVEMGKLPTGIKGPYELNLIIVQDKYVCKTVLRSYLEQGDQESNTPLGLLPMPESVLARVPPFEPRSESTILNFTIPFEKNKSEFKPEDIKPFIDALQEPDFIIDGLFIYAYSSIEGDSVANAKLQRKRGESVVKVLQSMQNTKITPSIMTNDSWNLFQLEMEDGKFDYLTKMSKKQAIREINSKGDLLKELEPTLSKQRFAQIVMDVTYDISGKKEQKFSVVQYNRAVKQANLKNAYKIMDFISRKVNVNKYTEDAWNDMQFPEDPKFAGLLMNKVYYNYVEHGKVIDEDHYTEIQRIQKIEPSNPTINFNAVLCKITLEPGIGDKNAQAEMQNKIDAFYKTDLAKKDVDALNVEWQFKLMEALDTIEGSEPQVEAIINKIKSFYNFKEGSWENALKLAFAFSRAKDYRFACNLLEPFLFPTPNSPANMKYPHESDYPKVLYAYLSMASHVPEKFFSRNFVRGMEKTSQLDRDKFCKLIGEPNMSFQVLDNPKVKEIYRSSGCK